MSFTKMDFDTVLLESVPAELLLVLLRQPAGQRTAVQLIVAARDLVNNTPVKELAGLVAALAAHIPAIDFAPAKRRMRVKQRQLSELMNKIGGTA
jgi:hypothetical protein